MNWAHHCTVFVDQVIQQVKCVDIFFFLQKELKLKCIWSYSSFMNVFLNYLVVHKGLYLEWLVERAKDCLCSTLKEVSSVVPPVALCSTSLEYFSCMSVDYWRCGPGSAHAPQIAAMYKHTHPYCTQGHHLLGFIISPLVGPFDFCDVENMDGITEPCHKNGTKY